MNDSRTELSFDKRQAQTATNLLTQPNDRRSLGGEKVVLAGLKTPQLRPVSSTVPSDRRRDLRHKLPPRCRQMERGFQCLQVQQRGSTLFFGYGMQAGEE